MKKKLFLVVSLLISLFLMGCSGTEPANEGAGSAEEAAVAITPTPIVLETPTAKPAPPTPTSRPPSPAPLVSAQESEEEALEEEVEELSEPEGMALIPAGPFLMGQDGGKPKNGPAHQVDLSAYWIDKFEVTNDQFAQFVEETGYVTYAEDYGSKSWRDVADGRGNYPVVYVTWNDAVAYCEWVGKRLPTEAEWEKAARGEDGRIYPWGDTFPEEEAVGEFGNMRETGLRSTFPVGAFEKGASPYGLYDMAGNVREWTADPFLPYPGMDITADRFFGEENRINRGGGWFDGQDDGIVTTFNRNAGPPDTSANDDIGFRCARDDS